MRSIVFSFALFAVSATVCNAPQQTEYEIFAQKYEATFGEKPSDKVWNLNKKSCEHCQVACGSCSVGGGRCAGT